MSRQNTLSRLRGGIYYQSDEAEEELHEVALCVTAKGQSNWTGSFVVQELPDEDQENR